MYGGQQSWGQKGGGKDWSQGGGQSWGQGGASQSWSQGGGGGGSWGKGGKDAGKGKGGGQDWSQGGGSSWGKSGGGGDWGKSGGSSWGKSGGGQDWGKGGGSQAWGKGGGASQGEVGPANGIRITGCQHDTVGPIIRGDFYRAGENHGKPAYKKEAAGADGLTVMIYFWDERDGPAASGWWIGPSIGGNMVWGHHPDSSKATPPSSGWQAPHSAPEDNTLVIAPIGQPAAAAGGWGGAAAGGWAASQAASQAQEAAKAAKAAALAKQEEQKAVMAIRKEMSKLKTATPESLEKAKEELAVAMGTHFEKCGSMQATVQAEHDKALAAAQERVEGLLEARRKSEEKKKELEEKKAAQREASKQLVAEFAGLVEEAEAAAEGLTSEVKALGERAFSTEAQVESACDGLSGTIEDAKAKSQACQAFLKEKGAEIKLGLPPPKAKKQPKAGEAKAEDAEDEGPSYGDACRRANQAKSTIDAQERTLAGLRRKLAAKAAAAEKMKAIKGIFTKYDKDKDGHLNKKEILALAKGEYSFALPDDRVQLILTAIARGGKGVKADDFQRLLAAIGSSRELALDKERRAAREAREAELDALKKAQQELIDAATAVITEAGTALAELQNKVRALQKDGKALKSQEMLAQVEALEAEHEAALSKAKAGAEGAEKYGKDEVDKDLQGFVKAQKSKMEQLAKTHVEQLGRTKASIQSIKDAAAKKNSAEVKALAAKALKRVRAHLKEKAVAPDALFEELAGGAEGVKEAAFVAFVKKLPKAEGEKEDEELADEDIARGFGLLAEDGAGESGRETFCALIRTTMKVVKDVALTPERAVGTETVRRLEVGEAVEVLEGPVTDDGLERVRVRAFSDEKEGWVSLKGNAGTKFLQEGGHTFKVVKDTILTSDFDISVASAEEKTRKLKVGEMLEVRQFGRKHEDTGLTRMKCRAKADGLVGWVTTLGNTGVKFVEML